MIEPITDIKLIMKLWNTEAQNLGAPYYKDVQQRIDDNSIFVYKVGDEIAGMVSYWIYNRKKEVAVESLIVFPKFRGQHISTKMIKYVYEQTSGLIETIGYAFTLDSNKASPSHKYHEHYSTHSIDHTSRSGQTTMTKYYLDTKYFQQ